MDNLKRDFKLQSEPLKLAKFRVHLVYNIGLEIKANLHATIEVVALTRASAERLASNNISRSWHVEIGKTENLGEVDVD